MIQSLFLYIWRVNWRWYITGIIIALAFYGAGFEQSTASPNQEIVVRFSADSITANDAKKTISEITRQLKSIGVDDVHVSEVVNGKVKVTYFSTLDVAVVKSLLYRYNKLDLSDTAFNKDDNSSQFPFSNSPSTYKLEIVQIQTDLGSDIGFQGILVEVNSLADQYLKPRISLATSEINFTPKDNFESADITNYLVVPEFITEFEHIIPEVRAGPIC